MPMGRCAEVTQHCDRKPLIIREFAQTCHAICAALPRPRGAAAEQAVRHAVPVHRRRRASHAARLRRRARRVSGRPTRCRQRRTGRAHRRRPLCRRASAQPRHKLPKTYWAQVEGDAAPMRSSQPCARGVDAGRWTDASRRRARRRRTRVAMAARCRRYACASSSPPLARTRGHRGAQSPGTADDRGGRTSNAAPCSLRDRPLDAGGPRPRPGRGGRPCYDRAPLPRSGLSRVRRSATTTRAARACHVALHVSPVDDSSSACPPDSRPAGGRAANLSGGRTSGAARPGAARAPGMVTEKLQEAGFKAFVVGGAVRDLLLGFDAQGLRHRHQCARRSRSSRSSAARSSSAAASGWSTSTPAPRCSKCPRSARRRRREESTDEHGRLISDNVYGTQAEDAARRDFTINALYFDPTTEEIWDYVGGVTDVRARRLKLIGAPVTRYREDPVRMLRAVRLAAKVGLAIDPKTAAPIPKLAGLIQNVPPARLFDEMQKLLLSGHAMETLQEPARARALARPAAAARRDPRAAAGSPVHRGGAGRHRRARARRQGRLARVPVRDPAVARSAAAVERRQGARREAAARALRRDGPRARRPGQADLDPAALRGDHQGNLVAAAALRAARRRAPVPPARAPALSRGLRFPRAARRRSGEVPRRSSSTGGRASRTRATREREAMLQSGRSARRSAPLARTRPQAISDAAGGDSAALR